MTDAGFDVVATGFGLAEGPALDRSGALWVADALHGGVRRVSGSGGATKLVPDRRGIGGLALHESGAILAGGRDIAVIDAAGARPVVTDPTATGFNDLGAGPAGELLAGVLRYRPLKGEPPVPGTVRIIDAEGAARDVDGEVFWPNGIAVSDTGWLYVADFAAGAVLRGRWSERPELQPWWTSPSGQADGLALDEAGCVLVALGTGGAFARVLPDGTTDRVHDVPGGFVSSVCFAGDELKDLIVTTMGAPEATDHTGGRVLRMPAPAPGLPVPPVRVPLPGGAGGC